MIRILQGDCRTVLRDLPERSVQCVVTSPPYYGLRDYGVSGQIGLEQSPSEYVEQMVGVFREVRRVLRDDGCAFLNLGDSYNAAGRVGHGTRIGYKQETNRASAAGEDASRPSDQSLKPKDLLGIPWRVAFALQADGWWLRSAIVWNKPNTMPESVTDRPTSSYEMVFLLAKSATYFYDADAIREEGVIPAGTLGAKGSAERAAQPGVNSRPPEYKVYDGTRNARNVWTIATQPFPGSHFATFPPELAERCVKAGTSEKGCCPDCGAAMARVVERETRPNWQGDGQKHDGTYYRPNPGGGVSNDARTRTPIGWAPSCDCPPSAPAPCTVLDPFGGVGTTGLVADRLGRDAILIELNPEYVAMSKRRIESDAGMFAEVA